MFVITEQESYTCPFCGMLGFTNNLLIEHVSAKHPGSSEEVICPICVSSHERKNITFKILDQHLILSHYKRDIISVNPSNKNSDSAKLPPSSEPQETNANDQVVPNDSTQDPLYFQYQLPGCFKEDNIIETESEDLDEKRASKSLFAQEILLLTLNEASVDCNKPKMIKSTLVDQAEAKICDSPAISSLEDYQIPTRDVQNGSEKTT